MQTVYDSFTKAVDARGTDIALVTPLGQLSYEALGTAVTKAAARLANLGARPGDLTFVLVHEPVAYVIAFLALQRLGAVPVPVEPLAARVELPSLRERFRPRFVVTDRATAAALGYDLCTGAEPCLLLDDREGSAAEVPPIVHLDPDAPGAVFLTSGTSGASRAVLHSQGSLARASVAVGDTIKADQEIWLTALPFQSIAGHTILSRVIAGGDLLVAPGPFSPKAVVKAIATHGVQRLSLTPAMLGIVARVAGRDSFDVSSVSVIGVGSSPLHPTVADLASTAFGAIVVNTYGSTELGGPVMRSIGRGESGFEALESSEVRVARPDGTDADVDEQGELLCRTEPATPGYLVGPGQVEPFVDEDGWYRTGDLAARTAGGRFVLLGRACDLAFRGGRNVYLVEVEGAIASHPGVSEVAVVATSTERGYDDLAAFVVPVADVDVTVAEILAHCRVSLAAYKVPNEVVFCDDLPRASAGKVKKSELLA
jgi:acyl-CoA synthetase (AMP-forming)/AMP-acid ligase II